MKKLSEERLGEILVFGEMTLSALFPIIISYGTRLMPPIFFAGTSTLTAGIVLFFYLAITKQFNKLRNKKTIIYSLWVTLLIIIIPCILIFIGTSKTSGINTSLLLQSEIVFMFIIYSLLKYEVITKRRIFGAIIIILGTAVIVYNGSANINLGDILIIAGTLSYPIGNIFARKALGVTTTPVLLFIRNSIGGLILIAISLLFETYNQPFFYFITNFYPYILLSGILVYCISKVLWYEGLRKLEINKAILISLGGYPAASLLFTYVFLHEVPTTYQWVGFFLILGGLFITITKAKKLLTTTRTIHD